MAQYAQLPDGIILPEKLAATVFRDQFFGGGAHRSTNPNNRNTAGWITSGGSADSDSIPDLQMLRQQSSDLVRNEALPAGIVAGNATAVVGTGIVPQARVNSQFLGISDDQAGEFQSLAEMIFNQAAEKPHWDSQNKQTFWQQQALVQRSMKERGDVFAVRRYIERKGKKLGLAVQVIEADRVSTPSGPYTIAEGASLRAGCEMDANGAAVAWHIRQTHPGEMGGALATAATDWTRVAAFDDDGNPIVLPVIPTLRPGQTRGIPYLAPVIEMLKQLTRYGEAEIAAAVVSGMLAVMVTKTAAVGPLGAGITVPGAVTGGAPAGAQSKINRLQSGMILDLAPGEDVKVVDSTRPNTAFDPFVTAVLRQIGAALEVPFEILIKHFTSSYSASRAALLEFWRFVMKERDFLVVSFCQPCWEWAIHEAVAKGFLKAPGFFDDPMTRAAWLGCDWIGQGVPALDPLKDAYAAEAWNGLGIWSLQDISAQQGRDFDRTHRQLVRENAMRRRDGIGLVDGEPVAVTQVAPPADAKTTADVKPKTDKRSASDEKQEIIAELFKGNEE